MLPNSLPSWQADFSALHDQMAVPVSGAAIFLLPLGKQSDA